MPVERNTVFISYSRSDKKWLDRLMVHLRPLVRDDKIKVWNDTMLKPGTKWKEEIDKVLKVAKVAILLVTADFLASDFIATDELPPLLKAAQDEGAVILPVIVSACRFLQHIELSQFQAVNAPSDPLINMKSGRREAMYVNITEAVEEALKQENKPNTLIRHQKELNIAHKSSQEDFVAPFSPKQRRLLHGMIEEYFNDNELRTLCFDLNIDYESLPAEGKAGKARELVAYAQRHKLTDDLIERCRELRPHNAWLDIYQDLHIKHPLDMKISVDTRPIMGNDKGGVSEIYHNKYTSFLSILNTIWSSISDEMPPWTYGLRWAVQDSHSGKILLEEHFNSLFQQKFNSNFHALLSQITWKEAGIVPDMELRTIPLNNSKHP
jgi:hypothetical protein